MMKVLYIAAGFACVCLGVLGALLPGLPSTPLFMLALFCFAKGSNRILKWFEGTALYKKRIEPYAKSRSMTVKQKIALQILVWSMMAASFAAVDSVPVRIFIAGAFFVHNYFIFFKIKTARPGRQAVDGK
jgi:uncharacterized membrane protein YbaN (DUF454 family)